MRFNIQEPRDPPPIVGVLLVMVGVLLGLVLLAWLAWGTLGLVIVLTAYLLVTVAPIVLFLAWYLVEEAIRTLKRLF